MVMKGMFITSINVTQFVLMVVQTVFVLDQILVFAFRDIPETWLNFVCLRVLLVAEMVNANRMVLVSVSPALSWISERNSAFLFVVKDV